MANTTLQSKSSTTEMPQPAAMNRNNPAFLNKLRSMVDDPNTDEFIRWSAAGDTFLVPNHVRFGEEVLPRFFKHNNFSSFVRQLNMYGFHKVPHLQQGALKSDQPSQNELWEFSNQCFHRDHPDLLSKVQRKRSGKERDQNHPNSIDEANRGMQGMSGALTRGDYDMLGDSHELSNLVGSVQMSNLLSTIQGMKNNQRTLVEELSKLQHSSQALWQQSLENRQQVRRQQDTINRILRFLASVFGSSNVGDILSNPSGAEYHNYGMSSDGSPTSHDFQTHGSAFSQNGRRGPVRPQKRARLLISDTPYADPMAEEKGTPSLDNEELTPVNAEQRFTEATSDTDGGSPKLGMTPPSPSSYTPDMIFNGNSTNPDAWQSDQTLRNMLPESDDNSAWLANILANQGQGSNALNLDMSRLDPQFLRSLQHALHQQPTPNVASTRTDTPGLVSSNTRNGMTSSVTPYGSLMPNMSQAWRQPIPQVTEKDNVVPEEQLFHNVQRLNQEAKNNMDQTNQLQNQIQTLVKNLRLEPNQARNMIENESADSKSHTLADSRNPGWIVPSSILSTSYPSSPANLMNGVSGNAQNDFDLDSFLNQFVDPVNQHSPSFDQANSLMSEESPDAPGSKNN